MELFVNRGLRLPTSTDYDLRRNTVYSEVLSLSLTESEFLKNQTSMADYYLIAVYGDKNSTF